MPAVSHRGGGRRRTISEINMVPFIDVMLVLLIIFMVSAPLITTGVVDLPTVGKSSGPKPGPIFVVIRLDGTFRLKLDNKEEGQPVALNKIAALVQEMQNGKDETPVVISADKNVKYDAVVNVMSKLQMSGIKHVALMVKNGA